MPGETGRPGGARAEASLETAGEAHGLLYTNRALANAERNVGKPIGSLLNDFRKAATGSGLEGLSVGDVAGVMVAGLEEWRRDAHVVRKPYTLDRAFAIMDELGFVPVVQIVMAAVVECFQFDPADAKQAEDDAADPTEQASP